MNISMGTSKTCNTALTPGPKLLPFDVVLYGIQAMVGLPAHSYIVWLIVTVGGTGIASEFFNLNTSVCEIILCLRALCATMVNVFPWIWDIVMCLSGFVITGRFFQCLICVERYLAVVHPLTFLKCKPLRYRVACSVLTWLMIAVCCLFILLGRPCLNYVVTYLHILQFFLFLCINLFCCVAVLRALKQSGPGERAREKEEENHTKRKAFYLILITTVTLIIMYVPGLIVAMHHVLLKQRFQDLDSLSLTCFILSSFVHPFLFIHRVGKPPFCRSG